MQIMGKDDTNVELNHCTSIQNTLKLVLPTLHELKNTRGSNKILKEIATTD